MLQFEGFIGRLPCLPKKQADFIVCPDIYDVQIFFQHMEYFASTTLVVLVLGKKHIAKALSDTKSFQDRNK